MLKYSFVALFSCLLIGVVQNAPDGRIVGGSRAKRGQFPYQVLLQIQILRKNILQGLTTCGGSIISENYILTAAHCLHEEDDSFKRYEPSAVTIHAGTSDRHEGGVKILCSEIIIHPHYVKYKTYRTFDDIALLRLAKHLEFSRTVKPIALSRSSIAEGTLVTASGFGKDNKNNQGNLQWIELKSISKEKCEVVLQHGLGYNFPVSIGNSFCLAHQKPEGLCTGDSGGPVVANKLLVGVISSVILQCNSTFPDIVVDVAKYYDWIKSKSDLRYM